MPKSGRPIKYVTADDLLDHCTIKDDCFIWPKSSTAMPLLSPYSPMAKEFGTNSVMRILFTICRFPPAGSRLTRWCNNPFCVNPYHHSEAKEWRAKRSVLDNPNDLLPEQKARRHLIAPPDELLVKLRPTNTHYIRILMDSAALAGFDARGIVDKRSFAPAVPVKPRYAEPDKPVLVLKKKPEPIPDAYKPEPEEQPSEELETIFDLIERRNAALRTRAQNEEQGG